MKRCISGDERCGIELAARLTEGKAHQEPCITFVRQRADLPAVHCYDIYHRVSRISTIWIDLSFKGGNPLQDSRKESTCYLVSCFSLPPILFIEIYIYIYICIVYLHISLPMVTSPGAAIWALAYGGLVRAINLIMAILSKDGSSC
jgi:hypothetical protein